MQPANQTKSASLYCPHCGKTSPQIVINTQPYTITLYNETGTEISYHDAEYNVVRCQICLELLLYHVVDEFTECTVSEDHKSLRWGDLVYPIYEDLPENVPQPVRQLHHDALAVKAHSPIAFVVLGRRLLEEICKDKLGKCSNLTADVSLLVSNGTLPPVFGEFASLVRLVGNAGAHNSEVEINPLLASKIQRFTDAIIEYLYILPMEAKEFKKTFSSLLSR